MKKRFGILTLACTVGVLALSGPAALAGSHSHQAAGPISPRFNAPLIRVNNSSSSNWAGYVNTPVSGVTDVKGQWVVPSVKCPGGTQYSVSWVGIDGDGSNSVEQEGTGQDCNGAGSPSYYSWYEICCIEPIIQTPMAVHPGDTVSAETKYLGGGNYQMILHNLTTGGHFSTTQNYPPAQRVSAEWIQEAPSVGGSIAPLANFGTVHFSSSVATIGGRTGVISSFPFTALDMVSQSSGQIKAKTSGLGSGGNNFTVTWKRRQ